MTHTMNLKPAPFSAIVQGYKTIELRLYDEKRQKISVGDTLIFSNTANPDEKLYCIVKHLHIFESFADLYKALPLEKCGYTKADITTARADDMNVYYSEDEQRLYGVVGIEIELTAKINV